MPKGKSAEEFRRESFRNSVLGIVFLVILIYAILWLFNFLRYSGIF